MKILVDRTELESSICRDSFFHFVKTHWHEIIAEDPVWNWHIEAMCDEAQAVAERVFAGLPKDHDLLANVPPGSTKSTIFSVMFPAWVWTRMPTARFICSSYAQDVSLTMALRCRDVIESDTYRRLFPEIQPHPEQWAKGHFKNTHGGERFSTSTDGRVTGMHGHFIIVDDPLNPKEAASDKDLATANRFQGETLASRKVDKAIAVTLTIMQRLHQNDTSAMILKKSEAGGAKVRHINLPAEIEGHGRDVVRPRKWAKHYKDGLLDPVRMGRKTLQEAKVDLGTYGYSGQMLQNPVPPGGGMFKVEKIQTEEPPARRHFKKIVRYWDKAGTEGGGAFTAGALLGLDRKGQFWILHMEHGQFGSARREDVIKQTARVDGEKVIVGLEQEPGSSGKDSALATAQNLAGFRVKIDRPTGSKVLRADTFSAQVNAGNVFMAPGQWNLKVLEELKFFPNSTYKDQVDALSGAFKILTKPTITVGGAY